MNPQSDLSDHPLLGESFQAELSARICFALLDGPRDFLCLVTAAEGAYPADVLVVLRRLESSGEVQRTSAGTWKRCDIPESSATLVPGNIAIQPPVLDGLPEPHPLDFDWRFSSGSLTALRDFMKLTAHESVAVLGAPTLFKHLVDTGVDAWLFDKNPQIIGHLMGAGYESVIECDLFEFDSKIAQFHWAVADPPWYSEHYEAFLRAAQAIVLPGARILLSVLPRLTRPSATRDRLQIVEDAHRLGLDFVGARPGFLRYDSPPFEIEALRAEGLALRDWRTGDLFTFVKRSQTLIIEGLGSNTVDLARWESISRGPTTIKIKIEEADLDVPFEFRAVSSTGSARLRSVSRRSPARPEINFWTSRNVALAVTKPRVVLDFLHRIKKTGSISGALAIVADEYQLSPQETDRLRRLVDLLDSEHE